MKRYVHESVCEYVFACVCIYVCVRACVYVCMFVYVCVCVCVCVCVSVSNDKEGGIFLIKKQKYIYLIKGIQKTFKG